MKDTRYEWMNRERTHGRVLPPPAHLLSYSPPSTRVSPAEREGCARLTRMEGMERVDEENDSGEITYEPPLFIPASVPRFVTLTSVPSDHSHPIPLPPVGSAEGRSLRDGTRPGVMEDGTVA